jgi:YgiT-type zinc finger domain-containing protein
MIVMAVIKCDICGKTGARLRRMTRTYGKGKSELLVRGVPVISCPHCGESYLTAETLRSLEHIKHDRNQVAVKEPVRVAKFKRVA